MTSAALFRMGDLSDEHWPQDLHKAEDLKGLTERKRQEIQRRISPAIDKTASLGKQIILTHYQEGCGD